MEEDIKAKYCIKVQPSWANFRDYKLKLFSDSLPTMKRKILRFLKLKNEDPLNFNFSIEYLHNSFILNNEEDFYFIISSHLQSLSDDPLMIYITPSKMTKKAILAKETMNNINKPSDPIYESSEEVFCAFCKESSYDIEAIENLGMFYGPFKSEGKIFYTHEKCAIWTPAVYLEDTTNRMKNLPKEIKRARKFICSYCGSYGAGLGCCIKDCKKTYHFKCSLDENLDCVLDYKNYTLYCSEHLDKTPEYASNNLEYETIFCKKCSLGDNDQKLIICEKCLDAYHIYCLEVTIDDIPEEDWFCENCSNVLVKICDDEEIKNEI